jgi:hypothetical protein
VEEGTGIFSNVNCAQEYKSPPAKRNSRRALMFYQE